MRGDVRDRSVMGARSYRRAAGAAADGWTGTRRRDGPGTRTDQDALRRYLASTVEIYCCVVVVPPLP